MKHLDRVFGCGVNPREFSGKIESLPKQHREKIERVAQRIRLITKLNYESLYIFNPDEDKEDAYFFFRFDLPSLQVYLYCTCIDTFAAKADYIDFEHWMRKQDATNLTTDKVIAFHKEYSNEFGNRKNFFDIFRKLPSSLKSWLTQNIAFLEELKFQDEIPEERNVDETIENLAEYLYGAWRNPFTHGAKTHPVDSKEDIDSLNSYYSNAPSLSYLTENDWAQQPMRFQMKKKKKKNWNLWHKKHLDINTILRLIIQCLVYDLLKIDVAQNLIEKNIEYINRHHWLYQFIHTARINADALKDWRDVDVKNSSEALDILVYRGIPLLDSSSINQLQVILRGRNPFEESIRAQLQEYKELVDGVNLEIQNFNKRHSRIEKPEREILENRKLEIKLFLEDLSQSDISQKVIEESRRFYSIWWLIRDNFIYDSENIPRTYHS